LFGAAKADAIDRDPAALMLATVSSGVFFALLLFATGLVLQLVWVVRTLGNPRFGIMLRKSVVFFLLPGALMVVLPFIVPIPIMRPSTFWAVMAVAVFVEELLKMSAARSERLVRDKFALAMLFGIFELMFAKPFLPPGRDAMIGPWTQLDAVDLALRGMLPVLMHTVTAALYAFTFAERPWIGLAVCFPLHFIYNFLVLVFPTIAMVALLAIVLAIILALNWPQSEPDWEWEQEADPPEPEGETA